MKFRHNSDATGVCISQAVAGWRWVCIGLWGSGGGRGWPGPVDWPVKRANGEPRNRSASAEDIYFIFLQNKKVHYLIAY